jgi:hypothetical protein
MASLSSHAKLKMGHNPNNFKVTHRGERIVLCDKHIRGSLHQGDALLVDWKGMTKEKCYECHPEWNKLVTDKSARQPWLSALMPVDVVYLSGPMSALPDLNRPAFHLMEACVKRRGVSVLSPAYADQTNPYSLLMRDAISMLIGANVVVMLLGWKRSKGAMVEHSVAEITGRAIYYEQPDKEATY